MQILVAADGSNSTVNKLLGINNVTRLTDHPMLQGRGPLSKASYAQLPPTLLEHGSTGFQEPDFNGFIAVYEAYQKDKTLDSSSFIFWAVTLKKDYAEKLNAIPEGQNKALQIAETMEATGWDPEQIPKILRMACTNVKMSSMSTSTQPDGWRKNRPELGRAILIGDSIHAMTRKNIHPIRVSVYHYSLFSAFSLATSSRSRHGCKHSLEGCRRIGGIYAEAGRGFWTARRFG